MRAIALRMAMALTLLVALVVPGLTGPGAPAPEATRGPAVPAPSQPSGAAGVSPSAAPEPDTARPTPPSIPAMAPAATTTAIQPGAVNRTSLAISATYNAYAYLGYNSRTLNVDSTMVATNRSGVDIDRLELNTIAARLGNLRLRVATVDGRAVRVTRSDQTLIVPLGGILPAGQSVTVRTAFRSTLRSTLSGSNWMFTRANGIVNAYRWLPWISLRRQFNRPNHGDPFVTPVSPEVRVRIRTDRPLTLATSGTRIAFDGTTKTFLAHNVRDFTLTAASYRNRAVVVGDNVVRVFYRPGAPSTAMLTAGRRALARMETLVGAYPYREFKVVQSAGGYGMESPGLIWIPTGAANLTYLVHHETAHQWFYSLVGNDQAREPFSDEAAADFLARFALGLRRASRCATARLDLSIYAYSSACYYEVVYIQGGNFLDDLRRRMGGTAFWRALRAYIAAHRFGLAPTKSLLDTLDAHTSLNLAPTFARRFPRLY
jgi:hypothetical protein